MMRLCEGYAKDVQDYYVRRVDVLIQHGVAGCGKELCRGCVEPGCCYQAIFEPLLAGFPIAARLRRDGRDTLEFRQGLALRDEAMRKCPTSEDWFDRALPCVFLKDKRCTVYEERPVSCRRFYVATDPKLCLPPSRRVKDVGILDTEDIATEVGLTFLNLQEAIGQDADHVYFGTLPYVTLIALRCFDPLPLVKVVRDARWQSEREIEDLATKGYLK